MNLTFFPNGIVRNSLNGIYAVSSPVDLSSTQFASVPGTLLTWLGTKLNPGETILNVFLTDGGQAAVTFKQTSMTISNADGSISVESVETPATFRKILEAAVTVAAPSGNGQRSLSLSSEELPPDLQSELLAAWASVAAL